MTPQFSPVAKLCPTLCDPMNCSMPGLPVHHQLLELTQTHVHGVGEAIQPSHPLSSPSPPAFTLSQHQGLFKWVSSLHQVATVWEKTKRFLETALVLGCCSSWDLRSALSYPKIPGQGWIVANFLRPFSGQSQHVHTLGPFHLSSSASIPSQLQVSLQPCWPSC